MAPRSKATVASVIPKIYDLLSEFSREEQVKIVKAALTLLGDEIPASELGQAGGGGTGSGAGPQGAKAYFDTKAPKGKMEELAVAARYREQNGGHETHTKEDFRAVIGSQARRNFDEGNFARDIANAKTKGYFSKGPGNRLSYNGQNYVDALPDRKAAKGSFKAKRGRKKAAKA